MVRCHSGTVVWAAYKVTDHTESVIDYWTYVIRDSASMHIWRQWSLNAFRGNDENQKGLYTDIDVSIYKTKIQSTAL
jgi:hypothetical protein